MTGRSISIELLEQLCDRWQRRQVPILDHLQDGLSDLVMDQLVAPLGLTLPAEARCWWGWHDGVSAALDASNPEADIGVNLLFYPLRTAVAYYQESRPWFVSERDEQHQRIPDRVAPADACWPAAWLPFGTTAHGSVALLDCSVTGDQPSPVYPFDWEDARPYPEPITASLGEFVEKAIDAIDRGAWYYDQRTGQWHCDPDKDAGDRRNFPFG